MFADENTAAAANPQKDHRAQKSRARLAAKSSRGTADFFGGGRGSRRSDPTAAWLGKSRDNRPPAVVSLVVSGESQQHVAEQLERLLRLKTQRNVKIGEVLITGTMGFPAPVRYRADNGKSAPDRISMTQSEVGVATVGPVYRYLEKIGLPRYRPFEAQKIIERLKLQYSPTWIVRHLGRDYVFEGFEDPSAFFNRQGEFIRE